MTTPATPEAIRTAKIDLAMHLNYGRGGYGYIYRATDWPGLTFKFYRPKRGERERRQVWVGNLRVPWGDWQQVCDLLNAAPPPDERCAGCPPATQAWLLEKDKD